MTASLTKQDTTPTMTNAQVALMAAVEHYSAQQVSTSSVIYAANDFLRWLNEPVAAVQPQT